MLTLLVENSNRSTKKSREKTNRPDILRFLVNYAMSLTYLSIVECIPSFSNQLKDMRALSATGDLLHLKGNGIYKFLDKAILL